MWRPSLEVMLFGGGKKKHKTKQNLITFLNFKPRYDYFGEKKKPFFLSEEIIINFLPVTGKSLGCTLVAQFHLVSFYFPY